MNQVNPDAIATAREIRRRAYAAYQRLTRTWYATKSVGREAGAEALIQPMRAAFGRYKLAVIHHHAVMELPCPEEA